MKILTPTQVGLLNLLGWVVLYYAFTIGWAPFKERWLKRKKK